MSDPQAVSSVKFFFTAIYQADAKLQNVKEKLSQLFGSIDFSSEEFSFSTPTNYYLNELGSNLKRSFFSFSQTSDPIKLVELKHLSYSIECEFEKDGKRTINLDPGYIDYNKLVLASFKYGSHKIYIGRGVWADITLFYEKGSFKTMPWTFPDFRDTAYWPTLLRIRQLIKSKNLN